MFADDIERLRGCGVDVDVDILAVVDIAALSVITTGVVGLAGVSLPLVLDARAERRQVRDTNDRRLDELRAVLDEAAQAAMTAMSMRPQREDLDAGTDYVAKAAVRMRDGLHAVMTQEARIAVRVSTDDALFQTYRTTHDALGHMYLYFSLSAATRTSTRTSLCWPTAHGTRSMRSIAKPRPE